MQRESSSGLASCATSTSDNSETCFHWSWSGSHQYPILFCGIFGRWEMNHGKWAISNIHIPSQIWRLFTSFQYSFLVFNSFNSQFAHSILTYFCHFPLKLIRRPIKRDRFCGRIICTPLTKTQLQLPSTNFWEFSAVQIDRTAFLYQKN